VEWGTTPTRPFCSVVCQLVDLGAWLDERFRIAGEPVPPAAAPPEPPAAAEPR
jgi:endogenous inhibitor of DNA gyrase (YacG/DUF329 family)